MVYHQLEYQIGSLRVSDETIVSFRLSWPRVQLDCGLVDETRRIARSTWRRRSMTMTTKRRSISLQLVLYGDRSKLPIDLSTIYRRTCLSVGASRRGGRPTAVEVLGLRVNPLRNANSFSDPLFLQ